MSADTTTHQRLAEQIADHDRDLATLRADINGVQAALRHVADTQKELAAKLDEFTKALSLKGKASVTDVAAYLQVVALLFAIIGGTVSGIVYIASSSNASRLELLSYKVDRLNGSFGWRPEITKTDPSK